MHDIPMKELMTSELKTVCVNQPLQSAITMITESRQSCALITDDKQLVGIITERDLCKILNQIYTTGQIPPQSLAHVMTRHPFSLNEDTLLIEALEVARSKQIRHFPITNQSGELVGLVTYSDLVNAHFAVADRSEAWLEQSVAERTSVLAEEKRQLENLSLEDGLLGIRNRRAMEMDLEQLHAFCERNDDAASYTVALIDIDHFKLYNDHYGHLKGDKVLKDVTEILQQQIRQSDRLYRYGGEEFLLLMQKTTVETSRVPLERIINALNTAKLTHEKSPFGFVTASIGVASNADPSGDIHKVAEVVQRADERLYSAKKNGRNRFVDDCKNVGGITFSDIKHHTNEIIDSNSPQTETADLESA